MCSSKTARRKRRQAARRKRKRMLRRQGRLPVHTRTERKRAVLERRRKREAERRRTRRISRVAFVVFTGITAGTVFGQAVPAAASARPAAAVVRPVRGLHWEYLSRQSEALGRLADRPEPPHNDGPDLTQDAFVPFVVTGAPSAPDYPFYSDRYGALPVGRQDELLHNELLDPAGYPGEWSTMGTASITPGRIGPHYSGGAIPQLDGYERYAWNWPTL